MTTVENKRRGVWQRRKKARRTEQRERKSTGEEREGAYGPSRERTCKKGRKEPRESLYENQSTVSKLREGGFQKPQKGCEVASRQREGNDRRGFNSSTKEYVCRSVGCLVWGQRKNSKPSLPFSVTFPAVHPAA